MKPNQLITLTTFLFSGLIALAQPAHREPVDYVNPLIESVKSRYFFFNSACRPFGMVNLSPDNILEREWASGYRYQENHIRGLTHVHDWGVGGLLLMPTSGKVDPTGGAEAWKTAFSHEREQVEAGYHQVYFDDYQMNVELTATTRVGFHRYTFDQTGEQRVLVYLGGQLGGGVMKNAHLRRVNDQELEGWVVQKSTVAEVGDIILFFVIRFDRPFESVTTWQGNRMGDALRDVATGEQLGAFATYHLNQGEQLLVKVGLSWCGADQARLNLERELDHWDFDRVHREARDDWNRWLSRIEVKGGTETQKIKFYTDLWRSLLGRRQVNDADGKYPDYSSGSLQVKQLPLDEQGHPKFMHLSSDALWLTMWNLNILWGMAYPEVLESFVNSALIHARDSGHLPRGPIVSRESWIMTSAPITELIVGAYMLGIRGFDIDSVYEALKKAHMPGGTMDKGGGFVQEYIDRGFVPETDPPQGWGGAGRVMEYVTQDWALAQLAEKLGKTDDAAYFLKRSANWYNLFDPSTGFIRPRNLDGTWKDPFDPVLDANFGGFVEANSWQTTWMAVHDVQGLVNLLGGVDAYCDKLNFAFEQARSDNFVGGYGGNYVNYANQPGLVMAHLFNAAGKPWLTQYWVREVYNRVFSDITPYGGYGGNDEDQGQMAALSALMAIGLFDIKGGCDPEPVYQITTPLFDTVIVQLNPKYYPGERFLITAMDQTPENRYIQAAWLNGEPLQTSWFHQETFRNGGHLHLQLGPYPNRSWGIADPMPSVTVGTPQFELTGIVCPDEVVAGEDIRVSYRVRNQGAVGTYFGRITLNGHTLARRELILHSGDEQEVSYVFRLHRPGVHQVQVADRVIPIGIRYRKSKLELVELDCHAIGARITGRGTVYNTGSDTIDQVLPIAANGVAVSAPHVRLLPGEEQEFVFTYEAPRSGTYRLRINGEERATIGVVLPAAKPEPGLILRYDFDDAATPLLDLSGNNLHPQRERLPEVDTVKGGVRFEKNRHLRITDTELLNNKKVIAISVEIYPVTWYSFGRILQKGAADNQFLIFRNGGDEIMFKLAGVRDGMLGAPLPPVSRWTHLICQYDAESGRMEIWMNGEQVASRQTSGNIAVTADPLFIGVKNERTGLEDSFGGIIRSLRIYDRFLEPAEIDEYYRKETSNY